MASDAISNDATLEMSLMRLSMRNSKANGAGLILPSFIPYSFRGSSNEEGRMSESIDRRQFLQSATLAATAATAVTGAVAGTALAAEAKPGAKSAQHSGPLTRRWTEQR